MRFMAIVRSTPEIETGRLPSPELLAAMGEFNAQLVNAGIMLAAEGLHPSAKGARIHFPGNDRPSIVDGPFAETKELIAGYWLVQVKSKEEAIEWFSRAPMAPGETIELRQVYEVEEFADAITPDHRERIEQFRAGA